MVIAVDPGTSKCGVALLSGTGKVIWRGIVVRGEVIKKVAKLFEEYPQAVVVVGGSTQGVAVQKEISDATGLPAALVDERETTMLARELFWSENRPGCFWGIFPPSFRPLPRPIDDYAAVIIGRRFMGVEGSADSDGKLS